MLEAERGACLSSASRRVDGHPYDTHHSSRMVTVMKHAGCLPLVFQRKYPYRIVCLTYYKLLRQQSLVGVSDRKRLGVEMPPMPLRPPPSHT